MMAVMSYQGAPLRIPEVSPHGIINLELARTTYHATNIYRAWQPNLIDTANTNTLLDFVFILCYGTFLFASSYLFMGRSEGWMLRLNKWICAAALIAPLFDVIENVLMFRTLSGHFSKEVIASTFIFAAVKFMLAAITLLFLIYSTVSLLIKKQEKKVSIV